MVATLSLGHSPDPDDAFMWWPLVGIDGAPPPVASPRLRFECVAEDIELLNRKAEKGELDITAISCAHYPRVAERYVLTACGASVGDGYGPRLVSGARTTPQAIVDSAGVVAVPGERTTAFLVASLLMGPGAFRYEVVPFDRIIAEVAAGRFAAGVVIHEGQLTFEESGLVLVEDLGRWWRGRTGLPLPLGANVVRRDLDARFGAGTRDEVVALLERSVAHALDHRATSIAYAHRFARDMDIATADEFVRLYVNHWTLDCGPRGRAAVERLLAEAADAGLAPRVAVDMIGSMQA
ncbi:MAG TPA: ABC transporter substrate-binding protein [Phycisphaerales bacterium]|nr:ABC transporter substrate-binding protein [Phycisphaerales bacterium]HMP38070.1 ABC transporter substrate-binding protein [Phycisphaerales bacterium]